MSPVSYLRSPQIPGRSARRGAGALGLTPSPRGRARYVVGGLTALALAVVAIGAVLLLSASASLTADADALAKVGLPLGGGSIQTVSVTTGPHAQRIPVDVRGERLWPRGLVGAHQLVSVDVTVKRPGWVSWLTGGTEHLRLTMRTPSVTLRTHYLTLNSGAPLRLAFNRPIRTFSYGQPGQLQRRALAHPVSGITLPRTADAGTIWIAAAPRSWETSAPAIVSWFPAGAAASAVADPAPGSRILPGTPITLTFSKPVSTALGAARPPVTPATPGTWHPVNSHAIVFQPEGAGYGLGATVNIALPGGVRLVGGQQSGSASTGAWTIPGGSTLRLQQILANLGYLPLTFSYTGSGVGLSAQAQEAAAINPPRGSFSWRYGNVPASLRSFWQPGSSGVVTRGALMAFENDHAITADGVAGPTVWHALINAALAGHRSSFGYTYVTVSTSAQTLSLWHNGHTVLNTAVNTGIASRPTATGTYPVYEHIASGTMSGTNPDGSHYNDPGIPWISYFNGGDALHGFTRASYGSPQSLGCVEMPFGPAGQVFPYTPIGTLVHVA